MLPPINIKGDLRPLQRAFINLRARQVPFANALALTGLAKGVQSLETNEIVETFSSPTPFTQKSVGITPATKARPIATVFVKNIAQSYLTPYVVGGDRSLGHKRAMLVPVDQGTNQYGNLPRNTLKRLQGKRNIFIGSIKTKAGKRISGVWQRPGPVRAGKRRKGVVAPKGPIRLLIEFKDTTPAPKHFAFYERAQAYLKANAAREYDLAIRRALSTAKPGK